MVLVIGVEYASLYRKQVQAACEASAIVPESSPRCADFLSLWILEDPVSMLQTHQILHAPLASQMATGVPLSALLDKH